MRLIALLTLLLAIAPAHAGKQLWYHPSKSDQDFHRDNARCASMALGADHPRAPVSVPAGNGAFATGLAQGASMASGSGGDPKLVRALKTECMLGEGWKEVPNDQRVVVTCDGWLVRPGLAREQATASWDACSRDTTGTQPALGEGTPEQQKAAQCLVDSGNFRPSCQRKLVKK